MNLLVIDNFDSFTYNLVQYFGELGEQPLVFRNNAISIDEIRAMKPRHIVISPGPGRPENAGVSEEIIKTFYKEVPILGVCLGHQAIGHVFGGTIIHAPNLMHGKTSSVFHDGQTVFNQLSNPFPATRYHSLVIEKKSLPNCLLVTAQTEDGVIMGVRHREYPVEGVQFHPESILTEQGKALLENFIKLF